MKKKTAKKKAVVRRKRVKSPYAQAAEEFDPYEPIVTQIQSETTNSGPTLWLREDLEGNPPGWWNRMWRRVFG